MNRDTTRRIWIEFVAYILLMAGALNWGLVGLFGWNLVQSLAQVIRLPGLERVIYVLVGLAALVHLVNRNFYLPFLGRTVFPCGSLQEKVPEKADVEVRVRVAPLSNVVFWAAEKATDASKATEIVENPWIAYDKNENTGVAKSDANGLAVLKVRRPVSYRVPSGRILTPHVHYRVCDSAGMMGPVQTTIVP